MIGAVSLRQPASARAVWCGAPAPRPQGPAVLGGPRGRLGRVTSAWLMGSHPSPAVGPPREPRRRERRNAPPGSLVRFPPPVRLQLRRAKLSSLPARAPREATQCVPQAAGRRGHPGRGAAGAAEGRAAAKKYNNDALVADGEAGALQRPALHLRPGSPGTPFDPRGAAARLQRPLQCSRVACVLRAR